MVFLEGWLKEKIIIACSRISTITLAGLSVQYVVCGLTNVCFSAFRANFEPLNLDEAADNTNALANIMFDARFTAIASTDDTAASHIRKVA